MTIELQRSFLMSPAAKSLLPREAAKLRADESYERFKDIRFGWTDGRSVCAWCSHERVYERANRATFKCAKCGRDFSVTSATPFHSRKLAYSNLLSAISMHVHGGIRSIEMSRDLGIDYKTAWVLNNKFCTITGNVGVHTTDMQWPFQRKAEPGGEHADLIAKVNRAVAGLPPQVRGDVAQDMILGVLSGDVSKDDLMANAKKYITRYYGSYDNRFACLSFDQPVPGTDGQQWADKISAEYVAERMDFVRNG